MVGDRQVLHEAVEGLLDLTEKLNSHLMETNPKIPRKRFTLIRGPADSFTGELEEFINTHHVTFQELQRNVFYLRKDGTFSDELTEELSAFLIWEDV